VRPLDLYSEPYSPSGNLASTGILNQLGRPKLDILQALIREAVQNSWDARSSPVVRFGISGWTLTEEQRQVLRAIIFSKVPDNLKLGSLLNSDEPINVLALYDRGTVGLGGPTRADIPAEGTNNFVNFVHNVGQPPVRVLSGGTYGYGKAAFYRASEVHTICIHTHCLNHQHRQSRFIAIGLGDSYSDTTRKFTGRHWWGKLDNETAVLEPVLNKDADKVAFGLGLPPFIQSELGTTVMVVQPLLGERTPQQALNLMIETLLWFFWPKMLAKENDLPSMIFEASWDGLLHEIPIPDKIPPLQGFVEAMRLLKEKRQHPNEPINRVVDIESLRPKQHLGKLSLQKFHVANHNVLDTGSEEETLPIKGTCHHIALMRQAELVVRYLEGPPLPTDHIEYAGVFLADKEVDAVFADSEPPAHDNWSPEFLEDHRYKTFIRVAIRRIKEALAEFTKLPASQIETVSPLPLGAFANQLGNLLPGLDGSGAGFVPISVNSTKNGGVSLSEVNSSGYAPQLQKLSSLDNFSPQTGSSRDKSESVTNNKRAKLTIVNDGELLLHNGQPAIRIAFEIDHVPGSCGTIVSAVPGVILDNGEMETESPVASSQPGILEWITSDGKKYTNKTEVLLPATITGTSQIIVSIPDSVMVGVDLAATVKFSQ